MKELFENQNLYEGRMICDSQSLYRSLYPTHRKIYLNCVVFINDNGPKKMWWGDLDIDFDEEKLELIAKQLNKKLYVLSEYEGDLKDTVNLNNFSWKTENGE